jgi:hypothetical protein
MIAAIVGATPIDLEIMLRAPICINRWTNLPPASYVNILYKLAYDLILMIEGHEKISCRVRKYYSSLAIKISTSKIKI